MSSEGTVARKDPHRTTTANEVEVVVEIKVTWKNGVDGDLIHRFGARSSKLLEYATIRMTPEPNGIQILSQVLTMQALAALDSQIPAVASHSARVVEAAQTGFIDVHDPDVADTVRAQPQPSRIIIPR